MLDEEIMYQRIYEIYKKCNIDSMPVDCFKILDTYNVKHRTYSSVFEKQKCHSATDDAFTLKKTIFYNDTVFERRTTFNLMHEFGHFIMDIPDGTQDDEDNADYFASCILAPRILIHHLTQKQNADEIHDIFGLSYAASNRAVADYNRWFCDIQYKKPRCPSDAERRLYSLFEEKELSTQEDSVSQEKPILKQENLQSGILNEQCKRWMAYLQREKRKRTREMAENKRRIQILQEYGYNFYQAAENHKLYDSD